MVEPRRRSSGLHRDSLEEASDILASYSLFASQPHNELLSSLMYAYRPKVEGPPGMD